MKKDLIKYLSCPKTHEKLILTDHVFEDDEIKQGILLSEISKIKYPIIDFIPILIPNIDDKNKFSDWEKQWLDKKFEFNLNENDTGIPSSLLRKQYALDKIDLKNKIILEGGCGGGRLTNALYSDQIKTYMCLDITNAIYEARQKHKNKKNIHFIMGDLENPPFNIDLFDIIITLCVLQHTRNPQKVISNLANTIIKNGFLIASYYMTPKSIFVRFKVGYCELIRKIFRLFHFPYKLVRAWAYLSVISFNKCILLRPLGWAFFQQADYNKSDKYTWIINSDFYNPNTYQDTKTREETKTLFLKGGFIPIFESSEDNGYILRKEI